MEKWSEGKRGNQCCPGNDEMVDDKIVNIVKHYLASLCKEGINASRAVLFGSYASGNAHRWSDIDLVIIAPEFDNPSDRELLKKLWCLTGLIDDRIEPVACGQKEWETDGGRPILEIARRQGITITV